MAEAFIDCTLDWGDKKGRTEHSRKAWAFIISFVTEKIKRGHLHEVRLFKIYFSKFYSNLKNFDYFAAILRKMSKHLQPFQFIQSSETSDLGYPGFY